MTIQVLGGGCAKCGLLEKEVQAAIAELGVTATIEKVTDYGQIANLGAMVTPALAFDRVLQSEGKVLTKDQIKTLVQTALRNPPISLRHS